MNDKEMISRGGAERAEKTARRSLALQRVEENGGGRDSVEPHGKRGKQTRQNKVPTTGCWLARRARSQTQDVRTKQQPENLR
jgi:hypothetical protein